MQNMDRVEQRACEAVAQLASDNEDLTIPANELPSFVAWCVKEFAEQMRSHLKNGG